MTIITVVPGLVVLLGLVVYLMPIQRPEVKEVARIAFFCGLLVLMFGLAGSQIAIGGAR